MSKNKQKIDLWDLIQPENVAAPSTLDEAVKMACNSGQPRGYRGGGGGDRGGDDNYRRREREPEVDVSFTRGSNVQTQSAFGGRPSRPESDNFTRGPTSGGGNYNSNRAERAPEPDTTFVRGSNVVAASTRDNSGFKSNVSEADVSFTRGSSVQQAPSTFGGRPSRPDSDSNFGRGSGTSYASDPDTTFARGSNVAPANTNSGFSRSSVPASSGVAFQRGTSVTTAPARAPAGAGAGLNRGDSRDGGSTTTSGSFGARGSALGTGSRGTALGGAVRGSAVTGATSTASSAAPVRGSMLSGARTAGVGTASSTTPVSRAAAPARGATMSSANTSTTTTPVSRRRGLFDDGPATPSTATTSMYKPTHTDEQLFTRVKRDGPLRGKTLDRMGSNTAAPVVAAPVKLPPVRDAKFDKDCMKQLFALVKESLNSDCSNLSKFMNSQPRSVTCTHVSVSVVVAAFYNYVFSEPELTAETFLAFGKDAMSCIAKVWLENEMDAMPYRLLIEISRFNLLFANTNIDTSVYCIEALAVLCINAGLITKKQLNEFTVFEGDDPENQYIIKMFKPLKRIVLWSSSK